jgi:hypothetical protein
VTNDSLNEFLALAEELQVILHLKFIFGPGHKQMSYLFKVLQLT